MKTLKRFSHKTVIALLLTLSQQALASPWPALENDKQKLQFGLALRSDVRPFFQGTFNYGMEWWRIADTQAELKHSLRSLYPAELDSRPLVTLTYNHRVDATVPDDQTFLVWKTSLQASLKARGNAVTRGALIRELFEKSLFAKSVRSRELAISFLDIIPMEDDKRKALKQSSAADKLAFLKAHLPEDIQATPIFSGSKYPQLRALVGTREKALQALTKAGAYETELPNLQALIFATVDSSLNANAAELALNVQSLDAARFAAMQSQDHVKLLAELFSREMGSAADASTYEDLAKTNASSIERSLKGLVSAGNKTVSVPAPSLILVEKTREQALLKSACGQDCSHTRASFTKLDDPSVRVFAIIDPAKSRELGYIVTELKESPIGDVLYLTSMNGPAITSEQTEEVFFALHVGRKQLGATKMVIAKNSVEDHINYQPITEVFVKYVEGKPTIQVHPKRPAITAIIDQHVDMEYMKEANHHEAIVYQVPADRDEHLVTTSLHENTRVMTRAIDKTEALLFALELDTAKRWLPEEGKLSEGERAAVAADMDLANYRQLREVFRNPNHLPYADFVESVKSAMEPYHVAVDKAFISARPYLFYTGQLVAPDATTGPLRKSTERLVAQLLKRDVYHPLEGLAEFAKDRHNVEAIDSSRELDSVFKWVLGSFEYHSFEMRNMAELGIGLPRVREPEFTRMLLRYVVHGGGWSGEQSERILLAAYPDLHELLNLFKNDQDADVKEGLKRMKESHLAAAPEHKETHATTSSKSVNSCPAAFNILNSAH